MRAAAYAKVNLGLRIRSRDTDGYHPLRGVFQTIDWRDDITMEDADEDSIEVPGGGAPADETNLAWRAVAAARDAGGGARPIRVVLTKRIPSPAGLGGGSADAAAALSLAAGRFSVSFDDVRRIAVDLGSDVPFAVVGGTAIVTGRGEFVSPQPDASGFALAVVVPPITLDTVSVYQSWDRLGAPQGPKVGADDLPPALRDYAPLANDLYPAAVAIEEAIDEWRAELAFRWNVPVMMTGSGAALFAYFSTRSEAEDAVSAAPPGATAARAAQPITRGWEIVE
ncbi:MAG: 4-(cytidine 5'-diphospho)-2-C-methyl-D-erythritol kinase [Actinomycetota bacterium]|nr:4-(cytidine 5'-diphospho)-2-C-methyl-D-erythritol kinase [Actinomycetota bacterium]